MEDAFISHSKYKIPVIFKDQANDLKNIEAEANEALQTIKTLYQDIMNPENYDENNFECQSSASDPSEASQGSVEKTCNIGLNNISINPRLYYNPQQNCTHCIFCHCQSLHRIPNNHGVNIRSRSLPRIISTEFEYYCDKDNTDKSCNVSKSKVKITKPQPFSFSEYDSKRLEAKQLKISKLRDELNRQLEKELNVKLISKPVPKHTHLPLYKEMMIKTEERKGKCTEIIVRGHKPFMGSSQSSLPKKTDDTKGEPKYAFKATPAPKNILSDKVTQRIRNKEIIRKMLITHRAEEMLKKSSSPLSKKNIIRSFSASNLIDYNKESPMPNSSKPNITAITNRLYNKKCKETMENWNSKVIRCCQKENIVEYKSNIVIKPKFQPEQKLPFLYYPVRMSAAALLREKQIRSEILAREKREEKTQSNENIASRTKQEFQEEIYRRLQTLIPINDFEKEIEQKVQNYKESHFNREMEYEKELEEIMKRVSKQYLLMERQSKSFQGNVTEKGEDVTVQELSNDSRDAEMDNADSSSGGEDSEEAYSSLEFKGSSN